MFYPRTIFLSVLLLFTACGDQQSSQSGQNRTEDGGTSSTTPKPKKKVPGTDDATGVDGTEGTDEGTDSTDGIVIDPPVVDNSAAGLNFFEKSVLPVLQAKCVNCHADPRQPAEIRGPLSIYSYTQMKLKLKGTSSTDNDLINKVMNKIGHDGADRCGGSFSASPCKEIAAWRLIENGEDPGANAGNGIAGRIFDVSSLGKVIGWAYNPDKTSEILTVAFYIDGPTGTGTKIGPIMANRSGADNNTPGDHAYLFDIPETFRDKKKHTLQAYAVVDGKETLIETVPYEFTAYAPSAAGRAFYNANVAGAVNGCTSCHAVGYEQHFYTLVSPAPSQGGTAINNVLINKAGTRNGNAHSGGNRCGGGNPCNVFEQWWAAEFGPQP